MSFNWYWGRRSTATGFPSRATRVHSPRRGERNRSTKRRSILESLEKRTVLTTFYVDANLALVADRDSSGGLSAGDQVTFGQGQTYKQANLTYDAAPAGGDTGTAFNSISQALASPLVQAGDTIDVAGGTYSENNLQINKSLDLQGLGHVVLRDPEYFSGKAGFAISGSPDSVTISAIEFDQFTAGISSNGGVTLNLIDLTVDHGFTIASVSGVDHLNLQSNAPAAQNVYVYSGTTLSPSRNTVWFQNQPSDYEFDHVANLSVSTGAAGDQFHIAPLADTSISIDGGEPTPGTTAGDSLEIYPLGASGVHLTKTSNLSGYSGEWTFNTYKPVQFADMESLSPGVIGTPGLLISIDVAEGVDSGNQVWQQFTDPAGNLPLADYSADINWGDGKSSTGTITFDANSGLYSVVGSHTYAEDGGKQVTIVVHRAGSADTTLYSQAAVSEPPITGTGVTIRGIEGQPLAPVLQQGVDVAEFSHGSNVGSPLEFSATVDWGDGTITTNTLIWVPGLGMLKDNYLVTASHTYLEAGTYTVKVTISDDAATTTVLSKAIIAERPLPDGAHGTPNQRFVAELYEDLLNRTVDSDALKYWTAKLDAGASRQEVVAGIQNSDEYRHDEIDALFQTYLHRDADQGALDADNKLLLQGKTLEQLASIIVSSDEYFHERGGGTNDGFLAALFQDALHRGIDNGAKTSFEQALVHGVTRAQIADHVFGSKEYRDVEVQSLYQQALDRGADQTGVAYWAAKLAQGVRDEQVLAGIMASQEYFDKTQQ